MKASKYIEQFGDFEITEEIEKYIPHKPKTVWDLQENDICYGLDIFSEEVCDFKWCDSPANEYIRNIGLITLTAEELEFKIERMRVYEQLKRFSKSFTDTEWKYGKEKYSICYDFSHECIYVSFNTDFKGDELYFESEGKVREAIAFVGEERVKKYYLGVGK